MGIDDKIGGRVSEFTERAQPTPEVLFLRYKV